MVGAEKPLNAFDLGIPICFEVLETGGNRRWCSWFLVFLVCGQVVPLPVRMIFFATVWTRSSTRARRWCDWPVS